MSTLRLAGFGTALVLAAVIGGTIIGSVAANTMPPASDPAAAGATGTGAGAGAQSVAAASGAPAGAVDAVTAGKYCDAFLAAYADALGVDAAALAPAASKAAASTIAAALAAGDINQAQADRLTARLKEIQLGGCPKFADRIGQARPAAGVIRDGVEAAAKALGLTPAELRAQLKSGKDLKEIATAQGVSYATVTAAALAPVKAKLDAAVAAGTIKQARADKIMARLVANLADGRLRNANPAPGASSAP